ncbi:hypothetical protein J437_LFUL008067 [Ladona fulva]|uniref:Uncharacterized protein n=1 Tax=Ladona fulva TaxID=123851 RepID=A0A8K0KAM9_LADFU|nr:hypothetical protein J437_LFUL008067 [Ladona fulva]
MYAIQSGGRPHAARGLQVQRLHASGGVSGGHGAWLRGGLPEFLHRGQLLRPQPAVFAPRNLPIVRRRAHQIQ